MDCGAKSLPEAYKLKAGGWRSCSSLAATLDSNLSRDHLTEEVITKGIQSWDAGCVAETLDLLLSRKMSTPLRCRHHWILAGRFDGQT